jgi:hypothetical protein
MCASCGLAKGSPLCCKLAESFAGKDLCAKCGEVAATENCCQEGAEKCAVCGLNKGAPLCCRLTARTEVTEQTSVVEKKDEL